MVTPRRRGKAGRAGPLRSCEILAGSPILPRCPPPEVGCAVEARVAVNVITLQASLQGLYVIWITKKTEIRNFAVNVQQRHLLKCEIRGWACGTRIRRESYLDCSPTKNFLHEMYPAPVSRRLAGATLRADAAFSVRARETRARWFRHGLEKRSTTCRGRLPEMWHVSLTGKEKAQCRNI